VTRLQDIIDGASGDAVPVATLLRQVKVLSSRLKTGELDTWVGHELNGYPADADLPAYRGPFRADVVGDFAGPFGSGMQNAPIPPIGFPEELRDVLFKIEWRQSISELEELAKAEDLLQSRWPADTIAATNALKRRGKVALYGDMGLQQAWRVISPAHVRGVVDTVRTRVLELALALEQIAPDVGEATAEPPPFAAVQNIVHNNIYGGATNVAIGSSQVHQLATNAVAPGDRSALFTALREAGIPDDSLAQLDTALTQDEQDGTTVPGEPGPRVRGWLGKLMLGTGSVAGKVATGAAGGVAGALLKSYFGL
jgi:AbiTii